MRDRSGVFQTVFALWFAALFCILVLHYVAPNDKWTTLLSRPVFLIIAPLVVALIPVLAAKAFPRTSESGEESEFQETSSARSNAIDRSTFWKMALVWLTALVLFAAPHNGTPMGWLDFIWHNPWFLLIAPVLLSFIALPRLTANLRRWGFNGRPIAQDSPYLFWKGLISGILLALILILCVIGANSMKGAVGKLQVNIALSVLLAGDLYALWKVIRSRRNRGR